MSVTRRLRPNARQLSHAALLASASCLSLTFATEAQAQCVTNNANAVGAISTDGTIVTCNGAGTGQFVSANANQVQVDVVNGGTVNGGSVIFTIGNQNAVRINSGGIFDASTIYTQGNNNAVTIGGTVTASGITVDGAGSSFAITSSGNVAMAPGQITIFSPTGGINNVTLGGLLTGTTSNGSYLVTGGDGSQRVVVSGQLVVQSDGLMMSLGDGDDRVTFANTALVSGGNGNNLLLDGGAGNDIITIESSGVAAYSTVGFERMIIDVGFNGVRTLTGSHVDLTNVDVLSGFLRVNSAVSLGIPTSNVFVASGATLVLAGGSAQTYNQNFAGAGRVFVTAPNVVTTFGGNGGANFTGTFVIAQPATALFTSGAVAGSGTIQNDGRLQFGDFTIGNAISGTGQVIKNGSGNGYLTGVNTFSGGLAIEGGGGLEVYSVGSLGTGDITSSTQGNFLAVNIGGNETLANNLTGALLLVKAGTGVLDLTGTNTYTGGTVIASGGLRVDDFARLGTGQVLANPGGSLILNYNGAGQLLQTTPFLTGAGSFIKEGTGNVVIDVANTYTGGTIIHSGTVGLNDGHGLGTGTIQVDAGATLGIGGVNLSNDVTGSGTIVKTASNQGALLGDNSAFTGLIDIQGGVVLIEDGRSAGSGSVNIGAGTALVSDSTVGDTTIAADLTGAGNLEKLATSRLTLTGSNTLTGTVFVGAGTLRIEGEQNIGTAGIVLSGAAGVLDLNTAGSTTLANNIVGNGRVVKTGTGTVFLTGANTYAGGTDIQQGAIRVTDVSFLGTGAITVQAGAALDLLIAGSQTLNQTVTGAGILRKSGQGALTLLSNGLTGGLDIQGGSVSVTGSGALGTGAVTIASGASLDYTAASNATFANGLTGAGTFNKLGTAQLTFGSNFSIGTLNALAGRTRINAVATTNATVASGATLDGTGRIIGNLVNNGTVAPGNSIGTLTVQGNYTHNAGSVLEIEFDASGNIDRLDVTGNAVLNGGTIRFVSIGGAEGQGGTFLSTGGTVTGTFATVETVGAQLPLAVFYTANTAQMAPSVVTARPSTFNAQNLAAADTALGFIEALGLADPRHGRGNRLWLSGFGAWGNRSASGATLAYDHDTRGISGGINLAVGSNVTLGAAIGWADGDITLGSNGGGGEQTHTLASLTARWQGASGLSLGAGALYGQIDQSTLRNVSFNGFGGSVEGATDSTLYGGFAEVGIPLGALQGWNIEATARASVIRQEQDGYTESGTSPLRLTLGDLATTTVEGQSRLIGTKRLWDASGGQEADAAGLDLRLDLGLRYLGLQGSREIPVIFAVSNAGIVLQGDTRDTLQGAGGIALDYTTSGGARLSLGYRGEFARTDRHTVQAGVSIAF